MFIDEEYKQTMENQGKNWEDGENWYQFKVSKRRNGLYADSGYLVDIPCSLLGSIAQKGWYFKGIESEVVGNGEYDRFFVFIQPVLGKEILVEAVTPEGYKGISTDFTRTHAPRWMAWD